MPAIRTWAGASTSRIRPRSSTTARRRSRATCSRCAEGDDLLIGWGGRVTYVGPVAPLVSGPDRRRRGIRAGPQIHRAQFLASARFEIQEELRAVRDVAAEHE